MAKRAKKKRSGTKQETHKRRLSIAHLHWGFPPIIGGVETHLTILLPQLVRMGHRVSLLTCPAEKSKIEEKYKGVSVKRIPMMDLNWLYKRGLNGIRREVTREFESFIDSTKPDILHAHNMHYFSKAHAATLAEISKKKGIPIFLTAHNVWDDVLFLDLVRNIKWTHIIAVSHFIRQELVGIGCNHRHITTIHHGIDTELYHPDLDPTPILKLYPQLKGKRVIFHPARMGLAKGCDVGIKAMKIVNEKFPDAMLVLAGTKNIVDWGERQQKEIAYMVNLVDFFKMRNNVLIDVYKLTDIPLLYAASQICIYPSTSSEPFGLTMLEAMASGKPMIVTRAGGMPEIIKDGVNGFITPVKDFEELASRITQLLMDGALRERLGTTGRAIAEQQYTKKVLANTTLNLYRKFF